LAKAFLVQAFQHWCAFQHHTSDSLLSPNTPSH
jgi:hypothetical protein